MKILSYITAILAVTISGLLFVGAWGYEIWDPAIFMMYRAPFVTALVTGSLGLFRPRMFTAYVNFLLTLYCVVWLWFLGATEWAAWT